MHRHRFADRVGFGRLPQSRPAPFNPAAFRACPAGFGATCPAALAWQLQVYQAAFAEAQAIARPSLPERDLLAVWN